MYKQKGLSHILVKLTPQSRSKISIIPTLSPNQQLSVDLFLNGFIVESLQLELPFVQSEKCLPFN